MTHLALPWWSKSHSSSTSSDEAHVNGASTSSSSSSEQNTSACCCLTKMMRRLKKSSKLLRLASSRQPSFQCRYDPLSYSLNFDTSGSGDEDYYKFCAFSSRFVATGRNHEDNCQRQRVLVAASH